MAEGRNPMLGCGVGCVAARCGWVPYPRSSFPRRDALLDAIGRTDNPCDRPARLQPLCLPTPKFRRPIEKPVCDINCYRQEQAEAQTREYCEQRQKYLDRYCPSPQPDLIIESLDPINYPIAVEMPSEPNPEDVWFLKDQPCRTNIIAGFFNPNDNKTYEELQREKCDPFHRSCGPSLPQYPCRGAIRYPCQAWTNLAQEKRMCFPNGCEGSKYLTPEYLGQQQELRDQLQIQKQIKLEQDEAEQIRNSGYIPPHPCCPERLFQTPYCNDCPS